MTELSRRKFIQLTVLSSAVAAAGCKPESVYQPGLYRAEVTGQYGGYHDRVEPYLNQPDGLQDGIPQYFATACRMCPAGCGLFVRTMGGRAIKIEGNPDHPVNAGKTCARGQSALQHLYNPDRLRFPAIRSSRNAPPQTADWDTAIAHVVASLQNATGRVAILADAVTIGKSPTLSHIVQQFGAAEEADVAFYSLLDDSAWRAAARTVYGRDQLPAYQIDQADYLVSFGGDFLEAWPSPVYYSRLFGEFRQGSRRKQGEHGKFVYFGPRMSMTAAKADQWIPCNPGTEAVVAQGLLTALGGHGIPIAQAAQHSGVSEAQFQMVAQGMRAAGARAVAMGGNGLLGPFAAQAFTAVEQLNAHLRSQCVGFGQAAITNAPDSRSGYQQIAALISAMQAGKVGALLILGQPNPKFTLPSASGWRQAVAKVPFLAALTSFEDETTADADVLLPIRTFLEDWGDDIPSVLPPGARIATLQQPIIDPQFVGGNGQINQDLAHKPWMDTRPLGDLLIDLANRQGHTQPDQTTKEALRRQWAALGQANLAQPLPDNDTAWNAALAQGGLWPTSPAEPTAGRVGALAAVPASPATAGAFTLYLYPHLYWTDGRHANLSWLQEIADPMTEVVWNSWAEINLQTAHQLGIHTGDIVRLTTDQGAIELPAVPYPGIHPNVIAIPTGQGHVAYGRNANGTGANPFAILDLATDAAAGSLGLVGTTVRLAKVRDAVPLDLVQRQDRPGGSEPEAVKDLIHTTAKEWKMAKPVSGAPQADESIFHRDAGDPNPGGN